MIYHLITTSGTDLGYTDEVRYIKKSKAGKFITCKKSEAIGVAVSGKAYNLKGHTDIDGAETAIVTETSFANYVKTVETARTKMQADIDYMAMMSDVDLTVEVESRTTERTKSEVTE